VVEERIYGEESVYPKKGDVFGGEEDNEKLGKSCEVYVCNLPRSCDAAYLLDMFRPYGTILAVEVTLLASLSFLSSISISVFSLARTIYSGKKFVFNFSLCIIRRKIIKKCCF